MFRVYLKIMTAVTSHQCLPEMIDEMPPGEAKDIVLRLCGHSDRFVTLYVTSHEITKLLVLWERGWGIEIVNGS